MLAIAAACTFTLVLPTAPPLAVAGTMGINVGVFFFCAPIAAFIGMLVGGIGLSLPNDSGFWAVNRFFHLNEVDTIRGWTAGGFAAGVSILRGRQPAC